MEVDDVIRTEGLTKRYGKARGIEDVSLAVRRNEVFGVLGPNGAGKTTTLRTLLGLQHPTAGRATVLGLDVVRDSRAIRARTGNRQKVGLIQALFHAPELLILDEPTGGLDPLMQEELLGVIAEERARGATVVLSSQELDEVQRACDRVAIIRGGRLAAVEDVGEMRRRAYRDVTVRFADPVDLDAQIGRAHV